MRSGNQAAPEMALDFDMPEFSSCIACIGLQLRRCFIIAEKNQPLGSLGASSGICNSAVAVGNLAVILAELVDSALGGELRTSTTLARETCQHSPARADRLRRCAQLPVPGVFRSASARRCPAIVDDHCPSAAVHCSSLRERSPTSARAAWRFEATSSRPSAIAHEAQYRLQVRLVHPDALFFRPASATLRKFVIRTQARIGALRRRGHLRTFGRFGPLLLCAVAHASRGLAIGRNV